MHHRNPIEFGPADSPSIRQDYPQRESHFSHRFTRLMVKVCLAQEIGHGGCWLLATIVGQEDASRYRRAVTFYDSQLMPMIGAADQKTLARIRNKAIEAGWLHYEHGRKGVPGRYWVLIPDYATGLDDSPLDEGDRSPGKMPSNLESQTGGNVLTNGEQAGGYAGANGVHSSLSQDTYPKTPIPEERAGSPGNQDGDSLVDKRIPGQLRELIDAWNSLPEGIAPRVAKPDAKPITTGWARVQRDPEAKAAFDDSTALMAAIEQQREYLTGKGWFDFLWLFKKDSDRTTWNVTKILNGKYRDDNKRTSDGKRKPSVNLSSSLRFNWAEYADCEDD